MIDKVRAAIRKIVMNSRNSTYQVMRVIELISKYDDKAFYHLSGKQKDIYRRLMEELKDEE